MKASFLALVALLTSSASPALAQPPPDCTTRNDLICVPSRSECRATAVCEKDLRMLLEIAKERKCLDETKPRFEVSPITIVTDEDGRVFHTGGKDSPKPFKLTMKWCHYTVEGKGEVQVVAAMTIPKAAGFRLRPKAFIGVLPVKLIDDGFRSSLDVGVMVDLAYVQWANLNVYFGVRSVGAGLGLDVTKNFGVFAGYGIGWQMPLHNVNTSFYFAF